MPSFRFTVGSVALGILCLSACSPKTGSANGTGGSGAGAANGASNGQGANGSGQGANGSGAGAGGDSNGNGLGLGLPGPTVDAGASDASCAATSLEPETITVTKEIPLEINCSADAPQPVSIYIMLDNSGSMKDNNKWTDAVAAITSFVNSDPTAHGAAWTCVDKDGKSVPPPASLPPPGSGSISVAIQYFNPVTGGNVCDGVAHSTPAVPMGPIPANGPAITGSLASTGPNSNTPTVGALTGGENYCTAYQAANPGKKCVLVLMTDGQPNGCGLSSSCGAFPAGNDCVDPNAATTLTPIAANGLSQGVVTFTVGMNGVNAAGFDLLNQIAIAGGSDCSPNTPGNETCNVTTGGSQAFLDALNLIRKTVQVTSTSNQTVTTTTTQSSTLPCEWSIPQPDPPQTFDQNLVNVRFTTGGATTELVNVATAPDCPASGGWYYDNVNAPTRILSCPSTCAAIQAKGDAQAGNEVQILVGCQTKAAAVH